MCKTTSVRPSSVIDPEDVPAVCEPLEAYAVSINSIRENTRDRITAVASAIKAIVKGAAAVAGLIPIIGKASQAILKVTATLIGLADQPLRNMEVIVELFDRIDKLATPLQKEVDRLKLLSDDRRNPSEATFFEDVLKILNKACELIDRLVGAPGDVATFGYIFHPDRWIPNVAAKAETIHKLLDRLSNDATITIVGPRLARITGQLTHYNDVLRDIAKSNAAHHYETQRMISLIHNLALENELRRVLDTEESARRLICCEETMIQNLILVANVIQRAPVEVVLQQAQQATLDCENHLRLQREEELRAEERARRTSQDAVMAILRATHYRTLQKHCTSGGTHIQETEVLGLAGEEWASCAREGTGCRYNMVKAIALLVR